MRKVDHDELQHIDGGMLPIAMVPLLALAFGLGLGTGMLVREANCPQPSPPQTPPPR
ncbi:hypothetical protein [Herbaspirillum sp. YR522]|uniref:hypothetical protein n=1 Tax=Herbaspirillum sp. YR522 TaxID=1144342 RepID=UPI00026F5369|nr:hypothetical protein [Herbaspirillum sp. YR522]EJN08424.1 hypothetical protein PMI40_01285 [Herbaspirillum sp. YR522]